MLYLSLILLVLVYSNAIKGAVKRSKRVLGAGASWYFYLGLSLLVSAVLLLAISEYAVQRESERLNTEWGHVTNQENELQEDLRHTITRETRTRDYTAINVLLTKSQEILTKLEASPTRRFKSVATAMEIALIGLGFMSLIAACCFDASDRRASAIRQSLPA